MKKIVYLVALLFLAGATVSCHSHHDTHDNMVEHDDHNHDDHEHECHDHDAHEHECHDHEDHDHHHGANIVSFSQQQASKIDFAVERLSPAPFGQVIATSAQVLPSQGGERQVVAKTSGLVLFDRSGIVEGQSVSAGQHLFSIESGAMAEGNMAVRFREVVASYQAAKADYERKQQLAADKIVSLSDLERAQSAYLSAKAAYDNLSSNFSASGARASSPMAGFIRSIDVSNGAYVAAGQNVLTVAQSGDIYLRAMVSPRYYPLLNGSISATFKLPNDDHVYTLSELGGGLVSFGKSTDASNPLIPVTFRIRNTVNLLSGSFVRLFIRTASGNEVLSIPNTGIVEEMGNYFVFVRVHGDEYEKRPVTLGATDGLRTVLSSGVSSGEYVVSRGAAMLKLAQGASALDPHAGHVH